MARRRYLVTYDICADKRRDRVFRILRDFGDHIQYSVFVCEVNERELVSLRASLTEAAHLRDDQVLFVDLGPAANEPMDRVSSIGRAFSLPSRVTVV